MGQGASPATFADPLLQRQSSRRSTESDGKQWQENPRCGPRNLGHTREENTGSTCTKAQGLSVSAPATCLHPESRTAKRCARSGIPTMKDRAQQALYLLALAPVVETTADKNSYGFRQQRSYTDAMEQCFKALRSRKHAVDPGGGHQVLFRQNFTRLAFGSRPDGPSHSPKVAEIWVHGKTRPSRNDGRELHKVELSLLRSLTARWTDLKRLLKEKYPSRKTSQVPWR